ncbi:hypothetical protein DM867_03195 [Halosegnis rubeus]|jgi:hypothetical protein|uniref:Uncharacterized protein n=1 Tax=Halosegnis rubeus TaxID=2212850 RepID=A0A5N5UCW7_9EURY|nr:hypothetical protein [Halosegnis rubeus]KAB7516159.1 hypothetical protein DM867_03195 [Halosegnis rubeus]KAB7517469.1 hypothetical protein DP108_07740 [Halosegnis rubeus]
MQRRVAAIYLVFFALLGASAFSVHALADQPEITAPGQEQAEIDTTLPNGELYENGSTFTRGGTQYTVLLSMEEASGGGHGGGGGMAPVGSLSYTATGVEQTAEWENGSTVTYDGTDYTVTLDADASPPTATLTQTFDTTALLEADSAVYNQTVMQDGLEYVTYRSNDTNVPLSEYLPEPAAETFEQGDTVEYENTTTTMSEVTSDVATLSWTISESTERELAEGGNVTLADDNSYFAHFRGHSEEDLRVILAPSDSDWSAYQTGLGRQDYYHERQNGLWGVIYITAIASLLIVGLAYMPVRG